MDNPFGFTVKADKIEYLLHALQIDKVRRKSRGVESSCPLAPWTHMGGRDNRPSFMVFDSEGVSGCRCQACNFKGGLRRLLWTIQWKSKRDLSKLVTFVHNNDQQDLGGILKTLDKLKTDAGFYSEASSSSAVSDVFRQGRDYSDPLSVADAIPALPDAHQKIVDDLHQILTGDLDRGGEGLAYVHDKRRLSDAAINKWKLGWHPVVRRVVIPQYDRNGRLINISGRYYPSVLDDHWDPPPWLHANGFKKEMYLFGENHLNYDAAGKGTVFLVEGMFDAIYLDSQGVPNVVAMLGAHLGRYQVEKLIRWFDHLVVIPDGDPAGYEAAALVVTMIGSRMRVDVFPTPQGLDPDELSIEQVSDIKSRVSTG